VLDPRQVELVLAGDPSATRDARRSIHESNIPAWTHSPEELMLLSTKNVVILPILHKP
jgi:hypothetical protein